ncbi:MAG TPA: tRNA (guanosine(37)-N1)-methyltransferase TrmD [Quisquiliibacterium sp.]|nr:tRNA (guanosine(37)-N1)-methyltransferase TrmD [Quisquiliibacterium sp.]
MSVAVLRFDVISIFPAMFDAIAAHGITARALERGLWQLQRWNPRDFTNDAYRSIDDRPYGGGPGMVMLAQPLADAIAAARAQQEAMPAARRLPVLHLSPRGRPFDHERLLSLVEGGGATLIASRYEAVDQRLLDTCVDEEVSVGDFVVSGGELPAMMMIDAAVRLVPGALNDDRSATEESFATGLLDCPQYTRPERYRDLPVPEVLLSGHHARIARWRRERALEITWQRRPELLQAARAAGRLSPVDERFLADIGAHERD